MPPAGSGPVLAKPKTPAPCRKNDRFSGKSSEKRDPLRQAHKIRNLARLGDLIELRVQTSTRPTALLELSIDVAGDVESPHGLPGREAQALEGNRELRDPSLVCASGACVPDSVPVSVQLSTRDHAIYEGPGWIRREIERAALVPKGVEENLDAIVGGQAGIARHLRADDTPRLGVVRDDADIEMISVVQERDVGSFRRRPTGYGLSLDQITDFRGRTPNRLVQYAINCDGFRRDGHDGRPRDPVRRSRLLTIGGARRGNRQASEEVGRGKRHEACHRVEHSSAGMQVRWSVRLTPQVCGLVRQWRKRV
jgi:hypothetical protein